jgi:hypothetical protein
MRRAWPSWREPTAALLRAGLLQIVRKRLFTKFEIFILAFFVALILEESVLLIFGFKIELVRFVFDPTGGNPLRLPLE